jgi:hypothetical protein
VPYGAIPFTQLDGARIIDCADVATVHATASEATLREYGSPAEMVALMVGVDVFAVRGPPVTPPALARAWHVKGDG